MFQVNPNGILQRSIKLSVTNRRAYSVTRSLSLWQLDWKVIFLTYSPGLSEFPNWHLESTNFPQNCQIDISNWRIAFPNCLFYFPTCQSDISNCLFDFPNCLFWFLTLIWLHTRILTNFCWLLILTNWTIIGLIIIIILINAINPNFEGRGVTSAFFV